MDAAPAPGPGESSGGGAAGRSYLCSTRKLSRAKNMSSSISDSNPGDGALTPSPGSGDQARAAAMSIRSDWPDDAER